MMASETFPFAFNGDRAFAQAFAGSHSQSVTLTVGIIGNHQSCLRMFDNVLPTCLSQSAVEAPADVERQCGRERVEELMTRRGQ